jgi:hypothetical protein
MSVSFKKFQTAALLFAMSLSVVAHADSDFSETFLGGLLRPRVYTGFTGKTQALPPKWSCSDRRSYWSVFWQAEIQDIEVKFDIQNPNITRAHLVLGESSVRAQHHSKSGLGCLWSGGEGTLTIDRIDVDFTLTADDELDFPTVSLNAFAIKNFRLSNVDLTYKTFFSTGFKRSSNGFGDWVETNLNSLIASFLRTSLKQRLDSAITKEVGRRLKEREDREKSGQRSVVSIR